MKKTLFIFSLFSFLIISCDNNEVNTDLVNNPNTASSEEINKEDLPVMTFTEEYYDFGEITQGEKVHHAFKFTNTGKTDLIIASANASCGCTVPTWPKKPIKPGEEGVIEVVFNSDNKSGQQNKQITVIANTQPGTNIVALKGNIIAPN